MISAALAETILRRYPEADQYPYRSWSYPQGFVLWGFIRLYEKTGNGAYRKYVLDWCGKHVNPEGEISGFTGVSLDDIMPGSVLVWAYTETKEAKYRRACERIRRVFDDYPRNKNGGFWHGKALPGEMWVDGLFMGLMFLTRYGRYIDDADYCFKETVRQLTTVYDCCNKDGTGLLYHAYSEDGRPDWASPLTGRSPEVWSEGLGWYAMMLAEAAELMPDTVQGKDQLIRQLQLLADSLARVLDPGQHLWFQVVDKPKTDKNWHDTSGSAMFLYSMHKARRLGLLGPDWDQRCREVFSALKTKMIPDTEGNINVYDACNGLCVQPDYDAYVFHPRSVNCQEAVAAALWAAAEMEFGGTE